MLFLLLFVTTTTLVSRVGISYIPHRNPNHLETLFLTLPVYSQFRLSNPLLPLPTSLLLRTEVRTQDTVSFLKGKHPVCPLPIPIQNQSFMLILS